MVVAATLLAACLSASPGLQAFLLPNGEPIVGVYYYPWFRGEPFGHVGWHPEFQFDNIFRPDHIRQVLAAMADFGINQASYSYWGDRSLPTFTRTIRQAEALVREGRPVYLSPYMEPPTIDKRFASAKAISFNTNRLLHFLRPHASSPAFCKLGGQPFVNIYVAYYRPDETDQDFREFLRAKYKSIEALRRAWSDPAQPGAMDPSQLPRSFDQITLSAARPGTIAFADRQELRAERLKRGWSRVIRAIEREIGVPTRYTGDNSNTTVSPTDYMTALTGLTWYSFGYAIGNPTRRPKLISEVAKYTGTTFLYTISPGYVDRQQRWPGARIERDPFLYEYAWVKALQTRPEGIMILTHSEWYEGSIIDVTREFGRRQYETTELYARLFKLTFPQAFADKRTKKPVAILFNEWATYRLHDRGWRLGDVYAAIKALECLSIDFDVIPESALSEAELQGRKLLIVPDCGEGVSKRAREIVRRWVAGGGAAVVERSKWWKGLSGRVQYVQPDFFQALASNFDTAWHRATVPTQQLQSFERALVQAVGAEALWPEGRRPSSSYELARGPILRHGDTIYVTVSNTIPWGYLVSPGPGRIKRDHSAELTKPWKPEPVTVWVKLPPGLRAVQAQVIDADSCRLRAGANPCLKAWRYDSRTGLVRLDLRCKFHAVIAIQAGQIALRAPDRVQLRPGESASVPLELVNGTDRQLRVRVSALAGPGLRAEAATVALPPRGTKKVALRLTAGSDYAAGRRTVVFLAEPSGGQPVAAWSMTRCLPPGLIGLRTRSVVAVQRQTASAALELENVGTAPCRDVAVRLLDAQARVGRIEPGECKSAKVSFTVPALESPRAPSVELHWRAGKPPQSEGLEALSGADGVLEFLRIRADWAVRPDPNAPGHNIYMYFRVDKRRLPPGEWDVEAEVEYLDTAGRFIIEYDSAFGDDIESRYRDTKSVVLTGTGKWRRVILPLRRAKFAGRQNLGADFRISGPVVVRQVWIRGLRARPETRTVPVQITWRCGSAKLSTTAAIQLTILPSAPARPEGVPAGAAPVWLVSPHGSHLRISPVQVPIGAVPRGMLAGRLSLYASDGTEWPLVREGEVLRGWAPANAASPVWLAPSRQPPAAELRRGPGDGYVAVEGRRAAALWDAERGAVLASLVSRPANRDMASPAGLCTVEYTLADGTHFSSARWPGRLSARTLSPWLVQIAAVSTGPAMDVEDVWLFDAAASALRLSRTIRIKSRLAAADFCPLVLRLNPRWFDGVQPLGVGFRKGDSPKRGWLETWHSEGWYFVYGGSVEGCTNGLALVVRDVSLRRGGRKAPILRRVRYGFVPGDELPEAQDPNNPLHLGDELQIRFRAQCEYTLALQRYGTAAPAGWGLRRRTYQPGDVVTVDAWLAVLDAHSWRAARELALLLAEPAKPAARGGNCWLATTHLPLRRPLYMYQVNAPQPTVELAIPRDEGYPPEVKGID